MRHIPGLAAFLGLACSLSAQASPPLVGAAVASTAMPIFTAVSNVCRKDFIPDSPARAFRRSDGRTELIATHYQNWMLLGSKVQSATARCQSIMPLEAYNQAARGQLWIQSTYTLDGQHVYGFASQDLTRPDEIAGCNPSEKPGKCWINQIVAVQSDDMGNTFSLGPVVASMGDAYYPSQQQQFGYFSTSNIVSLGKFYYVMIYLTVSTHNANPAQKSGTCLFRASDITKPGEWRGWDGTEFRFDPTSSAGGCVVVVPPSMGPVRSIGYMPQKGLWIALTSGRHRIGSDKGNVPGFYTLTSPDLKDWGSLARLLAVPLAARVDSWDDIYAYPSLIDANSKSHNFDTLDHATALLFFTDHHLNHGQGTMNRDLDFVEVTLH